VFRWLIGGLVVVAVVVLVAAFYPNENAPERGPLQLIGARLPAATLPGLKGSQLETAAIGGRPVLLNLWATWCGPCRREMPALVKLSRMIGLPSSFFIDRNGVVRDAIDGEMTYDMMTDKTQRLIAGG
jgi:thiol-disulfide isomerase/thioredoxin